MNNPLVSIISPSYNQAQFIEETILSIKNQKYQNIEHIIVDGGSNDGTLDIIKKYENTYNMKWISEKDDGMYDAISKGLKLAKGEILAYLNTDDLYFDWSIQVVVDKYNLLGSDNFFVYGDTLFYSEDQNLYNPSINAPRTARNILSGYFGLSQPSVFWTKKIYSHIGGFDSNLKFAGDLEYWIKGAKNNFQFIKINEFLCIDRLHSLQKRNTGKNEIKNEINYLKEKFKIHQKDFYFRIKKILIEKYSKAKLCLILSFDSFDTIDWKLSSEHFKKNYKLLTSMKVFLSFVPILARKYKFILKKI